MQIRPPQRQLSLSGIQFQLNPLQNKILMFVQAIYSQPTHITKVEDSL